ncbi:MAG: hypothetical protein RL060_1471 [Bacteroidota bacterium]|jgi:predicted phosphoribosyltransferase
MFTDRLDAAHQLAKKLDNYKDTDAVVLAIPRGGVPIGAVVARDLHLPLEILLAKKIGHPMNPEFAIGSVTLSGTVINPNLTGITEDYIVSETKKIQASLKAKYQLFMGDTAPLSLENKIVILVDDGIATGSTFQAGIASIKKHKPIKMVVAAPVASKDAVQLLKPLVDEIICVAIPALFYGVGQFYTNFSQVTDQEVISTLAAFRKKETMTDEKG